MVEEDQRCGYFERAVLPTADDIGQGQAIRDKYEKAVGVAVAPKEVATTQSDRECECGAPLMPRHRYCDRCAAKKRRESYRRRRQESKRHS